MFQSYSITIYGVKAEFYQHLSTVLYISNSFISSNRMFSGVQKISEWKKIKQNETFEKGIDFCVSDKVCLSSRIECRILSKIDKNFCIYIK